MSWIDSGGFHISRDNKLDSPGNGIRFTISIYIGNGSTVSIPVTKTDVQGIRREAARALKEANHE